MSCEPREKNLIRIRAVLLIIKAHQRQSYRFATRFGLDLLGTSQKCWRFLGLPATLSLVVVLAASVKNLSERRTSEES